jgi:hypothetical protein
MFWSSSKPPIKDEEKKWIEASLQWLTKQFGAEYFLSRRTILPENSFFPDPFRGTEECVHKLVLRVSSYMDVDPNFIQVELFADRDETASKHRLGSEETYSGAAGLYFSEANPGDKMKVAINISQLKEPTKLVATIAHELGHVILLGGGRISSEHKSHEFLTDLITVFLGMGIFTANAAFQFAQWQDHSHQGWRASRLGYMTEEMFGYSLAACAWMKNDSKAEWRKYLAMNVGHYFKKSLKYLDSGGQTALSKLRN